MMAAWADGGKSAGRAKQNAPRITAGGRARWRTLGRGNRVSLSRSRARLPPPGRNPGAAKSTEGADGGHRKRLADLRFDRRSADRIVIPKIDESADGGQSRRVADCGGLRMNPRLELREASPEIVRVA